MRNIISRVDNEGSPGRGCVFAFLGQADGFGRGCLLLEEGGRMASTAHRMTIEGKGWVWKYGEETATYTHISGEGEGNFNGKCWP